MRPYIPEDLPIHNLDFRRLFPFVGEANGELARFDGLLQSLLQPELMLAPLINEEAELSSRIEGTQATMEDILRYDAGLATPKEKADDLHEVINYRSVMRYAAEALHHRQISLGFIREMHQILMDGVRGDEKSPGRFRITQNYIGRPGCSIDEATFVPPDPVRLTSDLEAWERYISGDDVDALLQCAVMHAQFELIHPFNDGNGRIGRLLIPLLLFQKRKLCRPAFYISAYLEKHRDVYYDCLKGISREQDWNRWIEFFLKAISAQARNNSVIVKKILGLYEEMKRIFDETLRTRFSIQVLDTIFSLPVFQSSDFYEKSGLVKKTANGILTQLKQIGIIEELIPASGSKPALLTFSRLVEVIEGHKIEIKPG